MLVEMLVPVLISTEPDANVNDLTAYKSASVGTGIHNNLYEDNVLV
jgi:hypothetical protein